MLNRFKTFIFYKDENALNEAKLETERSIINEGEQPEVEKVNTIEAESVVKMTAVAGEQQALENLQEKAEEAVETLNEAKPKETLKVKKLEFEEKPIVNIAKKVSIDNEICN